MLELKKTLTDKKAKTVLNGFIGISNESKNKPNRLFYNKFILHFYNNLMQQRLDDYDIQIYPTHNEGNLIVGKRFIRPLKSKIYK